MEEITKKIQNIIDEEVSKKVVLLKGNVQDYKDFIEGFIETLDDFERNGREMLDDCKSDNLKFSEAEAEGFLRGVISIKNQFKHDYEFLNNNFK